MKTIKTIVSILISAIIAILVLQVTVATILQVLSLDPVAFLPKGAVISGNMTWFNWFVLVFHHGLMTYALLVLRRMVKGLSKESFLLPAFAKNLKVIGLIVLVAELVMSYVNSQVLGYISIDLKLGVYLILAGFAASYTRSYMAKHNLLA